MVVGNDKEALNAATMICPATIETNLATMSQSGHGRCILTDKDNNKVFAKWTCNGNPANCKGAFTFTGGTGKFEGISGINEFFVKTDVLAFQKTGEPGMVKRLVQEKLCGRKSRTNYLQSKNHRLLIAD